MNLRSLGVAAAAAVALACAAAPASADNYPVRDGTGASQTFCSKLVGGLQHPCHLLEVLVGGSPAQLSAGQAAKASSLPVTLPSDPDTRATAGTITAADVASTTVAGQSSVTLVTGSPTANAALVWPVNGHSSATIAVSGTFVASAAIESSADGGVTYAPSTAKILGTGATSSTVTAPGIFRVDVTGMTHVRLRSTSYTSGTVTALANASAASGLTQILNPVRLADSTGAVTGVSGNPLFMASADGGVVSLGANADAACGTDNGTCSVNAVLKRIAQRQTSTIAALGSPFQAGGALGAGSAIIGKVGIDQTTPGTTNGVQVNAALPAGSAIIGKLGIDQTTPGTTNGVQVNAALPAGEAHLGEVGGNAISITVAQTVTAASAYATGNSVGGLMTLSNAARVSTGSGLIQAVVEHSKSAQTTQVDVFLFSANPSGSTCTDKTAFDLVAADFDKLIGVVHVTDWTAAGATRSFGQGQQLAMPFTLPSGTSAFACAVTRSTPTFTSTSDISFGFRILRN